MIVRLKGKIKVCYILWSSGVIHISFLHMERSFFDQNESKINKLQISYKNIIIPRHIEP